MESFKQLNTLVFFYFTSMLLRLPVVVYPHEKDVSCVVSQLGRIVLPLDLADGSVKKRLHMH